MTLSHKVRKKFPKSSYHDYTINAKYNIDTENNQVFSLGARFELNKNW